MLSVEELMNMSSYGNQIRLSMPKYVGYNCLHCRNTCVEYMKNDIIATVTIVLLNSKID